VRITASLSETTNVIYKNEKKNLTGILATRS